MTSHHHHPRRLSHHSNSSNSSSSSSGSSQRNYYGSADVGGNVEVTGPRNQLQRRRRRSDDNNTTSSSTPTTSSKTTAWTAYLHLVKGTVGPGCLSLPWAISQLGIVNGCICLVLVALWTSYNCIVVVNLTHEFHKEQQQQQQAVSFVEVVVPWVDEAEDDRPPGLEQDDSPSDCKSNLRSFQTSPTAMLDSHTNRLDDDEEEGIHHIHHDDEESSRSTTSSTHPSSSSRKHVVTYPMLSQWLYGKHMATYTICSMMIQQLAICTVFLSFVATNVQAILLQFASSDKNTSFNEDGSFSMMIDAYEYEIIVSIVALICGTMVCILPNLKALAPLTAIGTALLLTGLSLLGIVVGIVLWNENEQKHDDTMLYDVDVSHHLQNGDTTTLSSWWMNAPLALCALLYAFEGICLVLPVQSSMKHPHQFTTTFTSAMITATIIFGLVAAGSVAAFGPVTQGSITAFLLEKYNTATTTNNNDDHHAKLVLFLVRLANAAVSLSVLVTYPLQLFPCLELLSTTTTTTSTSMMPSPPASPVSIRSSQQHQERTCTPQPQSCCVPTNIPRPKSGNELELLSLLRGNTTPASVATAEMRLMTTPTNDENNSGNRAIIPNTSKVSSLDYIMRDASVDGKPRSGHANLVRNTSTNTTLPCRTSRGESMDITILDDNDDDDDSNIMVPGPSEDSSTFWTKILLVAVTYVAAMAIPHVETLIAVAGAVAGSSTALLIPPALQWAYLRRCRRNQYSTTVGANSMHHNHNNESYDDGSNNEGGRPWYTIRVMLAYVLFSGGLVFMIIGTAASIRDIISIYFAKEGA